MKGVASFPEALYEDEHLLVVNKPAGLTSLPDGYDPTAPHVRSLLEPRYGKLWIVHRLDRETSGALALARSPQAHRSLNTQFERHLVEKRYHALAAGSPGWEAQTLQAALRINVGHKHRSVIDPAGGKPAETLFQVVERFSGFTLLEAVPQTGRTHQIRVHLAHLGFPILGDALYGSGQLLCLSDLKPGFRGGAAGECPILARLGLHAYLIRLEHPANGQPLQIIAPYPNDLKGAIRQLRRYARQA